MTSSARDARWGRQGGAWAEPIPGATCPCCNQGNLAWMAMRRDPHTGYVVHAWPLCNGCRDRIDNRTGHQRIPGLEWAPLPKRWPGRAA